MEEITLKVSKDDLFVLLCMLKSQERENPEYTWRQAAKLLHDSFFKQGVEQGY